MADITSNMALYSNLYYNGSQYEPIVINSSQTNSTTGISSAQTYSTPAASYTTNTTSGSTTSASGNNSFLEGLGQQSGIDIDSIVSKLMTPYQEKIDAVQQDQQKIQWAQQDYNKIVNDVKNFQNTYLNVANPDMNILSPSFFLTTNATSSDNNSVTVSASSSAASGNYSLAVNSLATAATIKGNSIDTSSQVQINNISEWNGANLNLTIDGSQTSITLDNNISSLSELSNNLNKAIAGNSELSGKLSVSTISDGTNSYIRFNNLTNSTISISPASGTTVSDLGTGLNNIVSTNSSTTLGQLGITDGSTMVLDYGNSSVTITASASETLDQFETDISSKTSGQISAKLDDLTGDFSLSTKSTGSSSILKIDGSSTIDLSKLGMSNVQKGNISQGADANVTITSPAGASETISETSNNFSINGISFNLKNTTAANSPVQINVSSDTDTAFQKVQGFMQNYNNLVTEITQKVNEVPSLDYKPLTQAQMSQMSSTDIQNWNAKSSQGALYDDSNLESLLSDLRDAFDTSLSSSGISLGSQLGIDFSSDYTKDGTLVFTDGTGDTFKNALKDNNSAVANLFTQTSSSNVGINSSGIFSKINDIFTKYTGSTGVTSSDSILGSMILKQDDYSSSGSEGSGTYLDQLAYDNNQLTQLKQDYSDKQQQYYQQYSEMEDALSQMNSQSASLLQQLQSLG